MNVKTKNKKILTRMLPALAGVIAVTGAPLAIVSCSASSGGHANPLLMQQIGNYMGGKRQNHADAVQLTKLNGGTYGNFTFGKDMDAYSGYTKEAEVKTPLTGGLLQNYMTRSTTGFPMYPSIDYNSVWNWNPSGVDMRSTAAQAKARATEFDKANPAFARMGLGPRYQKIRGRGWDKEFLGENDMMWEPMDWRFNRATLRNIAPSTYGAKLKQTQSTYSMFSFFTSAGGNAPVKEGLIGKADPYAINDFWTYARFFPVGGTGLQEIQIPDGQAIDAAHRNGTLSLGNINWTTALQRQLALTEDDAHHFPFARGLANIADFYGFDGYVFDTEIAPAEAQAGKVSNNPTLNDRFWKDYLYYARDLNKYPTVWSGIKESEYKHFKFEHKPQTLVNYEGHGGNTYNDFHYTFQMHGSGVGDHQAAFESARGVNNDQDIIEPPAFYDSSKIAATSAGGLDYANVPTTKEHTAELFKYSEGYNPGEAGRGLTVTETAARLSVENTTIAAYFAKKKLEVPEELKPYQHENRSSTWFWLYTQENMEAINKAYSSSVGDPRYSPFNEDTWRMAAGKSSLSDAFQEKSSVVGREPWATTFGRGLGDKFNLWGGNDISKYLEHGEEGWRTYVGQTALPTYRWIIDEYDQNGAVKNPSLALTDKGQVKRDVEPAVTSDDGDNWMFGSHLTYNGKIANRGESFENKLYASNIPVKSGDKFTIKVKNTDLVPDLAVWTHDGDVPVYSPNPNEGADAPTQTPWGDPLSNRGLMKHVNETVWNVSRDKQIIKPFSSVDLGNTGWTEITYDLGGLNGKTIMDFGIKVTATKDEEILTDRLRIGEMKFAPNGYDPQADKYKVNISNVKTEFAWDKATSVNARLSWDADKRVRTYLTFMSNDNGDLLNLMWVGSNAAAFLESLPKEDNPKVVIIGLNDAMDLVTANKVTLDIGNGGTHA